MTTLQDNLPSHFRQHPSIRTDLNHSEVPFSFFHKPGHFDLFYGPVCSSKSKALIEIKTSLDTQQSQGKFAGLTYVVVKPELDTRDYTGIQSRATSSLVPSVFVKRSKDILDLLVNQKLPNVIFADEVQFFDDSIVGVVKYLKSHNTQLYFGGLNETFARRPFGSMDKLSELATTLCPMYARCSCTLDDHLPCDELARHTQRLTYNDGLWSPSTLSEPTIIIDGSSSQHRYEPRCSAHHRIG
jgi:thymidine kinase